MATTSPKKAGSTGQKAAQDAKKAKAASKKRLASVGRPSSQGTNSDAACTPPDFIALRAAVLEPWLPFLYGNRFGSVLAIKGVPGAEEASGKPPFFGADGTALESALAALGWGSNNWCGIALELPEKGTLNSRDVRLLIEILDPQALIALDEKAMTALKESFGEELLPSNPKPGYRTWLLGRALVYISGFEAALASDDDGEAKRRVWRELKALKN